MFYLAGQIFICLLLIMAIGFLMGWLLRSVGVSRQFVEMEGTWKMRLKQKDEMLSKMFSEMDEKEREFITLIESAGGGTGEAIVLKNKLQQANQGLEDLEARLVEKERVIQQGVESSSEQQSEQAERLRSELATIRGINSKKDNDISRLKATLREFEKRGEQKQPQDVTPQTHKPPPRIPSDGEPDELRNIFGIGPVLEKRLNGEGITKFRQVAAFTAEDIERIAAAIGCFPDRIVRDNWIEGAIQEHLRKYGERI